MKRALAISCALHVSAGVALLSVTLREGTGTRDVAAPITIEIVAPPSQAPVRDVAGGGASAAAVVERAAQPVKHAGRATKPAPHPELAVLGDYAIDRSGFGAGYAKGGDEGDGGDGTGTGGNRGAGIGFGDGARIVLDDQRFAIPEVKAVVPPPSKARPAKLIYPTRERDLGADKLFVAKITVDTDGYVVGAHLVHGSGNPHDGEAADLIFRFRYLPALDDAGRAIVSTFEQPFHVNR